MAYRCPRMASGSLAGRDRAVRWITAAALTAGGCQLEEIQPGTNPLLVHELGGNVTGLSGSGLVLHSSMESEFFASRGLERRVSVAVDQFGLMPEFVVGSDCIATLHSRLALLYARRFPLRLLAPPLEMPPTLQVVQWHAYQDADPSLIWFRQLLAQVANG